MTAAIAGTTATTGQEEDHPTTNGETHPGNAAAGNPGTEVSHLICETTLSLPDEARVLTVGTTGDTTANDQHLQDATTAETDPLPQEGMYDLAVTKLGTMTLANPQDPRATPYHPQLS